MTLHAQHSAPVGRLRNGMGAFPDLRPFRVLAFIMAILPAAAFAVLDPPALRCASVNVAGDVALTWTVPADPGGEFDHYEVFWATDIAGPYVALPLINTYGQTSLFHAGAGANAGPIFYYMITVSTGPTPNTSVPSDTVATLFLQVFQSTPLGSANLSWNANALPPTAIDEFSIWMEYPVGTWSLLAEVSGSTFAYQHVIAICEDSLTFRVGYTDLAGCTSFSNRDGEVFRDVTPPSVPVMTAVTVDPATGLSTLSWSPSSQSDTDGYIIVLSTPGGGVIIDTVFGQFNTNYQWAASLPGEGPESFTLAAFDTCLVGIPPSPNTSATGTVHATMHLTTTYDQCAGEITLGWTPYGGWTTGVHRVFGQVDGGAWTLLAVLPGTQTSYVHTVQPLRTYCYRVQADREPAGVSSLSNTACFFTDYPVASGSNYLRTVTVTGPSSIRLVDSTGTGAAVSSYRITRSANGAPFEDIAVLPGSAGPVFVYDDVGVDPSSVGYRYQVFVQDACGQPAASSNIGGNMVLRAVPELSGSVRVSWNGYATWAGSTTSHLLYRSVDDGPFELIATLPPDPWTYVDEGPQLLTASTGRFCYYIQAVEGGNPSGINATSESNVACAIQEELVYIPNAMVIGGVNNLFGPVLSYADVTEYRFSILNRWGQIIWTTEDPDEWWNGIVGSDHVQQGIYAYYCAFRNGAGRQVVRNGTVTVLKAD